MLKLLPLMQDPQSVGGPAGRAVVDATTVATQQVWQQPGTVQLGARLQPAAIQGLQQQWQQPAAVAHAPVQEQMLQAQQLQQPPLQQQQILLQQQQMQYQPELMQQTDLQPGMPSGYLPPAALTPGAAPFLQQQQQHAAMQQTAPIAIPTAVQHWSPDMQTAQLQPAGLSPNSMSSGQASPPPAVALGNMLNCSSSAAEGYASRVADGSLTLAQQGAVQQSQQQQLHAVAPLDSPVRAMGSSPLGMQQSFRQRAAMSVEDGSVSASLLLMGMSPGSAPRHSGERHTELWQRIELCVNTWACNQCLYPQDAAVGA